MTSEGKGAADRELLRLIYLHLKENGCKKAANVLKKQVIQKETEVQTTLHEIYMGWIKTKREPEVDATPVRKARPAGCTREAEAEIKNETGTVFEQVVGSDAASQHPVVTSETRSSDGDSEEDAAVQGFLSQKAAETAKPTFTKPAVVGDPNGLVKPKTVQIHGVPRAPAVVGDPDGLVKPKTVQIHGVPRAPAVVGDPDGLVKPKTVQIHGVPRAPAVVGDPDGLVKPKTVQIHGVPRAPAVVGDPDGLVKPKTVQIHGVPRAPAVVGDPDGLVKPKTVQIHGVPRAPAVVRPAEGTETDSSDESGSEDQEPAKIPRTTPARQPATKKGPVVPVKDSLCGPLLPEATAWPPAGWKARTSDVESSAESGSEGPATQQKSVARSKAKLASPTPGEVDAVITATPAKASITSDIHVAPSNTAKSSDSDSQSERDDDIPPTQVYISQPSATPEVTGIGETSDSDRGNADAREDAPVQKPAKQTPSTGGAVALVKPLLFLSTPVLSGATRRTPAVEQEARSLGLGAEDRSAQQKTVVAPKAKPLPAAPKTAVRSTSPALVQPTSSNSGPNTAPAEAAGGNSESQSEDGLPLTQVLFTKAVGGEATEKPMEWTTLDRDKDMAVLEAPLTPKPEPVGLTSSSSASSSSISAQKTSVLTKKEERGSADSSGSEDGVPGAKAVSAPPLRTSKHTGTLAGAAGSTPTVGREARCWDTESSAEPGAKDRAVRQTITAASKVLSKRSLKVRTRNLLKNIEKICGGPDSSGRNETLLPDLTCAVATSLEESGIAADAPSQSPLDSKDAPVKSGEKKKRKGRKLATFPLEEQKSEGTSLPSSPSADPGTLIAEACEAAKTTTIGKDISLEDSTSKHLQASEVAPPTEQEAICTVKTSTGEAKRKRLADKMDLPAKKKKKKGAICSENKPEGRGGGAESDSCQGVEKQKEKWSLTLSDSDTSKEHLMVSVNTAPTIITLSGEKKWRRKNKKKKKVKVEDVENGKSESTWKMEKVTPGKAKKDYPSEVSQEIVTVSRKVARTSSSLKRALFALDTTTRSSKKTKKPNEDVASKPGPENKTKVLKKKVKQDKDKQTEAGRNGAKTAGSCEPVTPAGSLNALLRVKRREKNQIKRKNRKRKKMRATSYRFLLDTLSPMKTSPEPH